MNKCMIGLAAAAVMLVSASPAFAGRHPHPNPVSSTSTGGSTSSGGATSVPEPTDAVLLLMGVAGVVVGRRLHARKKQG